MNGPRALYAAFDRVPTAKGASIHIAHMAQAMQVAFGETLLACVSGGVLPAREREGTLEVRRLAAGHAHLVDRIGAWQAELGVLVAAHARTLELCHFRDPWSGLPILDARGGWRTVFEVNGLPSIEMPERYPAIAARTLEKIRAMELRCLHGAERVLVPAQALARNLARLGVDATKITVVPNGADLPPPAPRPADAPPRYVLYFGALQAWQGVGTAIAAQPVHDAVARHRHAAAAGHEVLGEPEELRRHAFSSRRRPRRRPPRRRHRPAAPRRARWPVA